MVTNKSDDFYNRFVSKIEYKGMNQILNFFGSKSVQILFFMIHFDFIIYILSTQLTQPLIIQHAEKYTKRLERDNHKQ